MDAPDRDIFISHAGADKGQYIDKLSGALEEAGVTYWLDSNEIEWADNIVFKINDGLARAKFGLVCFSAAFLKSPWPEAEMSSILNIQNTSGVKKMLPLILNCKEEVLSRYPLISALAYREFSVGPREIAAEIASMLSRDNPSTETALTVEDAHSGKLCHIRVPLRASVRWLTHRALAGLDISRVGLPISEFASFQIRWVLVDTRVEYVWKQLPRIAQQQIHALFLSKHGKPVASFEPFDRIETFELKDCAVFHLYAIEDTNFGSPTADSGGPSLLDEFGPRA